MSTNIDSLDIQISASAQQASQSLESLSRKLGTLSTKLGGLKNADMSGLTQLATVAKGFKNLDVSNISTLVNGISKLGGKNVERAIQNLPRLTNALNALLTSLSRSPQISKNTVKLIQSLAQLASTGNRTATASNRMKLSFNGLGSVIQRLRSRTMSLASVFGNLYANFFWVIRGAKALYSSIEDAMDYIEAYNYSEVTWGKVGYEYFEELGYESADAYTTALQEKLDETNIKLTGLSLSDTGFLESSGATSLGLDIELLTQYQAELGAVTNSLGLTGDMSIMTATALSNLAGDMSSLKNVDLETVMSNLQSGLLGQSRALYKYGIDITNATLQQYAYSYGLEKSVSEMTQAEKMQLRLLAILDQSKVAYGDLANTIQNPSNQIRLLKTNVQNLTRTIGSIFIPILTKVLPYINGFVNALQRLLTMFANLVGIEINFDELSEGYNSLDDDYAEDVEDTASAYDDATKAAEKYKKTILGIDQIHKLNSESSSDTGSAGSTSGGGTIDLSGQIASAVSAYQAIFDQAFADMENKVQEISDLIVNAFKTKNFYGLGKALSDSITEVLNGINWETVYTGAINFGTGLAEFFNGLITPEVFASVAKTIANSLNTAIKAVFAYGDTFDWKNLGNSIAEGINTFFEEFDFVQLAETLNTWVDGIETAIGTAIKNIKWGDVLKSIAGFVLTLDIDTVALLSLGVLLKSGLLGKGVKLTAEAITSAIGGKIANAFGVKTMAEVGPAIAKSLLGLGAGVLVPIGILLGLSVGGTAFGWKYQNDKEFQEQFDEAISNSPLKHVEANLDYGSYFDMEKALEKHIQRQNKRKKFVLNVKSKVDDFKEQVSDTWDDVQDFWDDKPVLTSITAKVDDFKAKVSTAWTNVQTYWKSKTGLTNISSAVEDFKAKVKEKWDAVVLYWKDKTSLSNISATIEDFKAKVKEKWDLAKEWWKNKGGLSTISTTVESIKAKIEEAWNNAKTWAKENFKLKFRIEYTTSGLGPIQQGIVTALKLQGWPTFKFYESGGFPSVGELFVANENGPEMIGRMGSSSVVANNAQITEGIAQAVYPAVYNAVIRAFSMQKSSNGGNVELVVNLEGREIARAVNDYNKLNSQMYNVEPRFV